ncbi:MAG: hypothetical protein Q9164_007884, partial [Protoblastenia rupestris]
VSVFGAQGSLVTERKEKLDFMLRLNYDFSPTHRYSIRVATAPSQGGSARITDLLYSGGGQKDARVAYEEDVQAMTTELNTGMQQALEAVLGVV